MSGALLPAPVQLSSGQSASHDTHDVDSAEACPSCTLVWDSVCYRVRSRGSPKWVLRDVGGYARAGKLLAILGPSGCGKSTLLSALGGRLPHAAHAALGGRLRASRLGVVAYVPQELAFFAHLSVRETLALACTLRRGQGGGPSTPIDAEVDDTLHRLGLADVADSFVGGDAGGRVVPGISGGERRRLAIGLETVGSPPSSRGAPRCILADEPTTGLDAFQADRAVGALKSMARQRYCTQKRADFARARCLGLTPRSRCSVLSQAEEGACVVCVLHAPRSASFARLDDVLLMAPGGRVAFCGPASSALHWFASAGFDCPPFHNAAEFLVDLVSIDTATPGAARETSARVARLVALWGDEWRRVGHNYAVAPHSAPLLLAAAADAGAPAAAAAAITAAPPPQPPHRPLGPLRTFVLLLSRAARVASRDLWVNGTRAAAALLLGLAFGGLNARLGLSQRSIQRRAALLMQAAINTAFIAMVRQLNGFPAERAVVRNEAARGTAPGAGGYGLLPYFLAKLCVEAPLDAFYPAVFGSVAASLAGLNKDRRAQLLGTLSLQGLAASALGLSVSALAPTAESALAIGPVLMVLSVMFADSGGIFAEIPDSLQPLARLSIVKWGFEGAMSAEMEGLRFDDDVLSGVRLPPPPRGVSAAVQRAAAAKMAPPAVRTGEEVLARMRLPAKGGVARAARAQARAVAINLGATLVALKLRGARRPVRWDPKLVAPREELTACGG